MYSGLKKNNNKPAGNPEFETLAVDEGLLTGGWGFSSSFSESDDPYWASRGFVDFGCLAVSFKFFVSKKSDGNL